MKHFVIGTAGHVDHGKTALIKAITGVDTDRLEEETFGGDMLRKSAGSARYPRNEHPDIIYGDPEYTWDEYIQSNAL